MAIKWESITNESEKLFLKTVNEYTIKSEAQSRELYTDFYEIDWMKGIIAKHFGKYMQDRYKFIGGYGYAERGLLACLPYDEAYDVPITILKVEVKTGIGKPLSHRDFLGSLLGLGIERNKIGDIITKPFGAYVVSHSDVGEFIRWNLTQIGRYSQVENSIITEDLLEIEPPKFKEITGTVASLRADAVLSLAFGISRTSCDKLLEQGKGKSNGTIINSSYKIETGEVLTLRGYGKIKVKDIAGMSKKQRTYITVERYI